VKVSDRVKRWWAPAKWRDEHPEVSDGDGYLCCFCGEGASEHDVVGFVAQWEDGQEKWQVFFAHGTCLVGLMHESVGGDGPIFDRFAKPSY